MDNIANVRAERIARNLPVKELQLCRSPSKGGEVYYAYGKGFNEKQKPCWHGIWFSDAFGGIGQTLEFSNRAKEKQVQQTLYNHAVATYGS